MLNKSPGFRPVFFLCVVVSVLAGSVSFEPSYVWAHDLRTRAASEYHTPNTCTDTAAAPQFADPPAGYTRKYNTIAHRFLDNETGAGNVTPAMYAILDALIDEASAALKPLPPFASAEEAKVFASQALRHIDCILLRHGFVYPGRGLVQLLSHGLEPTMYDDPGELARLQRQSHNIRRKAFLASRSTGPYYVVDCDTASFIYMAIAEVMRYPLRFVDIPTHNFVRWEIDANTYLNFETMDGIVVDDSYYRRRWGIPDSYVGRGGILKSMSEAEFLGYHDAAVAIAWAWRGDYARMTDYYLRSIARSPHSAFAANNLAWYYAAAPKLELRDGEKAVQYGLQAAAVLPDGDILDTLACAYAQRKQAGDLDLALRKIDEAEQAGYAPFGSEFAKHKALFLQGEPCNDPAFGTDPAPFRPGRHGMEMVTDKDLLRLR